MIRIISGTYGHRAGSATKTLKAGDIIELDASAEARLVKRGIAQYIGVAAHVPQVDTQEDIQTATALPDYDESMKLDVLREIAEAYEVDASKMRSKKEIIAAIDAALANMQELETEGDDASDDDGDSEDGAPNLEAKEPEA